MNCFRTEMNMKVRLFNDVTHCEACMTGSEDTAVCMLSRQLRGESCNVEQRQEVPLKH